MSKVASRMVTPRRPPAGFEEADERLQRGAARDRARINAINDRNKDKIGEFLGSTFYRTGETWAHLRGRKGFPLACGRYYPVLNIAVDIFQRLTEADTEDVEEKRRVLGGAGIRYGALTYDMDLTDLVAQVGIQ